MKLEKNSTSAKAIGQPLLQKLLSVEKLLRESQQEAQTHARALLKNYLNC